jgi:MSHA biogenesis protein MshL
MNRIALLFLAVTLAGCAAPVPQGVDPDVSAPLAQGQQRKKPSMPAVEQALIPPLRMEMPQVGGQPIDARFDLAVSDAPAAQVFSSLAAGTRFSMLVPSSVSGNITVNLKDVTLREALDAIRDLYGYEYRVDGTRILIQPAGVQTRVFQVNYLSAQRRGVSQLRVTSNSLTDPSGTQSGTSASSSSSTSGGSGGASTAGISGLLSAAGATGRESSRVITNQEATFWSDLCEALVALTFPDGGASSAAAGSSPSPEDRQRAVCNRRHAASDRSIIVSPHSGVIVVRALPAELRSVDNYLKATRVAVERQVMLEAKIIEVTLKNEYQSGINWAVFRGNANVGQLTPGTTLSALPQGGGAAVPITGGNLTSATGTSLAAAAATGATSTVSNVFGLALQTGNFSALLTFLETQGNVQVLSSPRVATLNNQKAVLKVGDEQLFVSNITVTPQQNAATGVVTGAIATPQFTSYFSGIVLDVTPQIDDIGNITLHVHPSINDVSNQATPVNLGFGNVTVPTARSTTRETDTIVRVTDGNIVAIGGLMRTEVSDVRSGLPGLMDSAFGWLFRSTSRVTEKKELVILLKPTIIESDRDWANDLRETQQRLNTLKPPSRDAR